MLRYSTFAQAIIACVAILLGPSVVFIFCLLAAIYPALKLYGLKPVEAMRAV